jgi:hypothetical protein
MVAPVHVEERNFRGKMISARVVQAEFPLVDEAEGLGRGHGLAHAGDGEPSVYGQGVPLAIDARRPRRPSVSATVTAAVTLPNVPCSTAPSSTA